MKKAIQSEFDQIQEYERRRDSLSDLEKYIFQECRSKLIDEAGWTKILEQEFYIHWIQ
jgi:hypothetical protein